MNIVSLWRKSLHCLFEYLDQPKTATVAQPMAWAWGRGYPFVQPMADECLWNLFENRNLNFKQYNTKTCYPIGLFSSLLANLIPIQYPSLSLFLWLFFVSFLPSIFNSSFILSALCTFFYSLPCSFFFERCMAINSKVTGGLFIPLCPVRRSIGLSVKRVA